MYKQTKLQTQVTKAPSRRLSSQRGIWDSSGNALTLWDKHKSVCAMYQCLLAVGLQRILSPSSWQSLATAGISWGGARERQKWESTPFCLRQFYQFIQLVQTCISTWRKHSNRTYVHYNVTAIPSLRCVRFSRQRTSQTRRSSALSYRDARARNSNSKHEQEADQSENATQYLRRFIYYLRQRPSAQERFPGQMLSPK